jgi:hypothetical protein
MQKITYPQKLILNLLKDVPGLYFPQINDYLYIIQTKAEQLDEDIPYSIKFETRGKRKYSASVGPLIQSLLNKKLIIENKVGRSKSYSINGTPIPWSITYTDQATIKFITERNSKSISYFQRIMRALEHGKLNLNTMSPPPDFE